MIAQLERRFLKAGLDSLEDYEIVKLLFGLVLPSRTYRKQAEECIRRFGNLREIIASSPDDLEQSGVAPRGIISIRLIAEIPRRVLKQKIVSKPVYDSPEAVFDYLYYSMLSLKHEVFKVIYLNSRNEIIEALDLFTGTQDKIAIFPRQIIEGAVRYGAVSMIFAHNHPSGDPAPSRSDKQITRDLVFIGTAVQIRVLDHLIIGDNCYFSFATERLIEKYENSFLTLRMKAAD